jgi:hypothetical protein
VPQLPWRRQWNKSHAADWGCSIIHHSPFTQKDSLAFLTTFRSTDWADKRLSDGGMSAAPLAVPLMRTNSNCKEILL